VRRIEATTFQNTINLREVTLEVNQITAVDKKAFIIVINLERICLHNNPVSDFFGSQLSAICSANKCNLVWTKTCLDLI